MSGEQDERLILRPAERAADDRSVQWLEPERVNLVPLASRVVAAMQSGRPMHKLRLAAPQGLTALVDPRRFGQLLNLALHDAIQRNPRGCWVDVEFRRPLVGLVRVEVRDYGRKVSPKRLILESVVG